MIHSISAWGYRKWFTEGKCDYNGFMGEVKRQGAKGFEIFPHYLDKKDPGAHVKRVARKAKAMGLEISSLIVANDFAWPQITGRAEAVENMKKAIANAEAAGIERLNVFTGYHREGQDPVMEVNRVIDCFREVAPVAEEKGVMLCIENHSSVCPDIDGLLWIMRAVGSPNLKSNPDVTNFCANYPERSEKEREVIYTSLQKFAPMMANFHLKIRDFRPDGDHAHVDIPRVVKILKGARYKGHVVLEYHGPDDPAEPNARGLALLRKHFA